MRLFFVLLIVESHVFAPVRPTTLRDLLPDIEILRSGALFDLKRLSALADDPLVLLRHQRMHFLGKMEVA